eukprot:NODE_5494_length_577_cov_271.927203.p1 GENE.NODE_5494_length_577_cov_271.927203~~NODE_5494_length_577_cov_271.927203.p1  ORF type:complete len:106 (+),score=33.83 NODE_5494_length_577_cov_271.927203:3-320(+)
MGGMGNLHVFPGAHVNPALREFYSKRIAAGGPDPEAEKMKPNLGESVPVLLEPGDIVIVHQMMAHRPGINCSEHIRYQLYYRLFHKDHKVLKERVVENPWVEYAV